MTELQHCLACSGQWVLQQPPSVSGLQENLRQLCVFKLASEAGQSYRWWEYVTKFGEECTMADNKYDSTCAEKVQQTYQFDTQQHFWSSSTQWLSLSQADPLTHTATMRSCLPDQFSQMLAFGLLDCICSRYTTGVFAASIPR